MSDTINLEAEDAALLIRGNGNVELLLSEHAEGQDYSPTAIAAAALAMILSDPDRMQSLIEEFEARANEPDKKELPN